MNNEKKSFKFLDTSLPRNERVEDLLSRMTLREKVLMLIEIAPAIERLGVPQYHHGNEALHGVCRPGKYTVFPQSIGLGSTFNDDLIKEIATAISDEARAVHHHGKGIHCEADAHENNGLLTFWSPDLNLCRDPRWGRTGETYGEDPYLAGKIGVAFVKGLQGDDEKYLKVVSTPKHFTANNEEHNRFSCNAIMSQKTLREYHLEPFRTAVIEGKCESIMAAYNAVNGVPCHENYQLLTEILRDEWDFEGYVVSDCGGIASLRDAHKVHEEPDDASAAAMTAGVDLECGGYKPYLHYYESFLEKNVADGKVSEERITDACRKVLTARFKMGMFDPDEDVPYSKIPLSVVGCPKHQELARRSARETMVLLKNNGVLPLNKNESVAVIGNNAHVCQFGDYSGVPLNEPVNPCMGITAMGNNVSSVKWTYSTPDSYKTIKEGNLKDMDGKPGLSAEYYANASFKGNARKRTDGAIDFAWNGNILDTYIDTEEYSVRWQGYICPDVSGLYTLRLRYHGSLLCEQPAIIIDGVNYGTEASLKFEAGKEYSVLIEYRKREKKPLICLEWILPRDDNKDPFEEELQLAAKCDKVVAVIGLGFEFEHEGQDKQSLDIPPEQVELIRRVSAVNKNLIVVLLNGSPVTIPEVHDLSAAVIEAWYPGEQGGNALADVLFGEYNPSGKLCASFPMSVDHIPLFSDYEMIHGRTYMYNKHDPLYPFGFGLSYTKFEYSDFRFESDRVVSVTVKNVGAVAGDEVVQLYTDSANREDQPMLKLIRFKKVSLKPGESTTVTFTMDDRCFTLFDYEGNEHVYEGEYTLYAGGSLPTERSYELGAPKAQSLKIQIK